MKIFSACVILAVLVSAVSVQAQFVAVSADPSTLDPFIVDNGPGTLPIYVIVQAPVGVTAVSFLAPMPACFEGATYLGESSPFLVVTGDSQTGVTIGLGACTPAAPVHVLTIYVFAAGLTDASVCCKWPVLPHPDVGDITITDCSSNTLVAGGFGGVVGDGSPKPPIVGGPVPADAQVEVPLDQTLTWSEDLCSFGLGVVWRDIYFGTTPDPPRVAQYYELPEWDPGTLSPNTEYHWRVVVTDTDGGVTASPEWTFRTIAPVGTKPSTWGKIKALYNNGR